MPSMCDKRVSTAAFTLISQALARLAVISRISSLSTSVVFNGGLQQSHLNVVTSKIRLAVMVRLAWLHQTIHDAHW